MTSCRTLKDHDQCAGATRKLDKNNCNTLLTLRKQINYGDISCSLRRELYHLDLVDWPTPNAMIIYDQRNVATMRNISNAVLFSTMTIIVTRSEIDGTVDWIWAPSMCSERTLYACFPFPSVTSVGPKDCPVRPLRPAIAYPGWEVASCQYHRKRQQIVSYSTKNEVRRKRHQRLSRSGFLLILRKKAPKYFYFFAMPTADARVRHSQWANMNPTRSD